MVANWHGSGGRSLILNGHVDVVPPASEALWSSPPFEPRRDGDWLYGRGAGDMKAGLVAMTGAVRALRRAGVELRGDLQLQSVVEEECTGNGTLQCLLSGAHADACVITEPHHDHFTVAQVGVLWFHVDVRGVPGHAARGGRGAFDAALEVLAALRALEAELNADPPPPYDAIEHPINLNPGVVTAGDWPSTVTAECTLSCRIAMYPGQDPAELQRGVEAAVAPVPGALRRLRLRRLGGRRRGGRRGRPRRRVRGRSWGPAGAEGDDGDDGRAALRSPRDPGDLLRPGGRADPRDRRARVAALDGRGRARARALRPGLVWGVKRRRRVRWP